MSRHPAYLLLLLVAFLASGCYKDAPERNINNGTTVEPGGDADKNEKTFKQNRWTFKNMKSDYLWEEHMPDTSVLTLSEYPKNFFEKLIYEGDRFSWIEVNPDYSDDYATHSPYDRYGIDYAAYLTDEGDEIYRLLLMRNRIPDMKRGDWFKIAGDDGQSLTLTVGSLDNGAFHPSRQVSLQAQSGQYTEAVSLDSVYDIDDRKIAYLFYNEFIDGGSIIDNPYRSELKAIFTYFRTQRATDLIIDLRYNSGGHVSICQYLASLMLKDEYLGEISGYHSFNKTQAALQYKQTGSEESVLFFAERGLLGGSNLGLDRVYFIITGRSASASESLINSLSPFLDAVKVGSQSVGKGVGSWSIQDRTYEWKIQPITFRYYNRDHVTVPDNGLTPDIPVSDDHDGELYEIGDIRERFLSVTLNHITGGALRSAPADRMTGATLIDGFAPPRRNIEGYIDNLHYSQ
ncbi:MAG: hypothetical protein LBK65_00815 [Tannerellaceae bacterium]|jgi:C-terminal processing protease CtpA/Prc|nr:hypothetical protein [Tannerellaceae bacterium]